MASSSPADGVASAAPLAAQAPRSSNSAPRTDKVLTVGDGNFSFSLALARQQHAAGGVALVATSFDSYDELVAKYPESARICEQLAELGARVLHRVDAANLRASLEASANCGGGGGGGVGAFGRIIFNHPHCGEENVRRHQSLLSHFYASALEVLAVNGRVHLALADGQPERWEALARAEQAGLTLYEQVADVDAHPEYGLEYERKRHQNGKSFHQVTLHGEKKRQTSTLFVFARASDVAGVVSSRSTQPSVTATEQPSAPTRAASEPPRKRKAEEKPKQTKQKKQSLAEPLTELVCHECDKSFKSVQGLKTHVHMVHELQAAGVSAPGAAALPCGYCDRTFKNEDAQRQHRVAKHGKDQLIKPDWYVATEQSKAQQGMSEQSEASSVQTVEAGGPVQKTPKTCTICRLEYASQEEFDQHWANLQPKKVAELLCASCGRAFGEERALRQHHNFCAAADSLDGEEGEDAGTK